MISDNIVVTVLKIQRNKVRIGIDAPKKIPVLHSELQNQILKSPRVTPDARAELKNGVQSCT
ncbi:carbon storage regulator [Adhaeretor mobilis]|nr:carbon storage regulator [Adhaeretor mobilis]